MLLRLERLVVWQEDPRGAGFDQRRRDRAARNVAQGLGGEDHRDVALAQNLEPLPDAGGEVRVVEEEPGLIQDQERRPAVESLLQAVEEIGEHRQHRTLLVHELLHLEAERRAQLEPVTVRVEQPAEGAVEGIGMQRLLECVGLQQDGEPCQRPLARRRARQAGQRRPERLLDLRCDGNFLVGEQRGHPLRRPGTRHIIVDRSKRLERQVRVAAEGEVVAAWTQCRSTGGAALVEDVDLGVPVAPELQGHEGEQHRLAGTGGAYNQAVADVAHMRDQPEGRRAAGLGVEQRRSVQMRVALGSGPDRRERHHVGQVDAVHQRPADVGVAVPRQGAEPGVDGIEGLEDGHEAAAVDDPLDRPHLLLDPSRILVPHRHCGGQIAIGDVVRTELLKSCIGVQGLVGCVAVLQRRFLAGHDLLDDRGDRLALGEPLAPEAGQLGRGHGLVERQEAGHPAVGEPEMVEVVEDTGHRRVREAQDRDRAQMLIAEPGLEAA